MYGRGQQQSNQTCRFYQQGRCKFGDNCKYLHPGADNRPQQNQNSFAALNNNQNDGRSNARPSALTRGDHYRPVGNSDRQPVPFQVTKENIAADLVNEKPQWPFSAYGPGRDAPRQLFGGFPLEQSFEEMRLMHYLAEAQGNVQSSIQSHQELFEKSQQQVQQVLNDLDGAVQYILAGKDEHPNRIDMCQSPFVGAPPPPLAKFGNITASVAPAFGQQPALGANAPKPMFGAPTQPGLFGQPSALGQSTTFGQPSAPGPAAGPGQPSGFGAKPGFGQTNFGQPSNLGRPTGFNQAPNSGQAGGFGQPSNPGQAGGFGQPSNPGQAGGFGQPSNPGQAGGFGQPSNPSQTGGFGQPSNPGQAGSFGQASNLGQQQGPFAQANAQPGSGSSSAFGQPSALGNNQPATKFGQPSGPGTQAPGFAQSSAPASQGNAFTQGFGQQSSFAQGAQNQQNKPNPFAQATPVQQQSSPFGQVQGAPRNTGFGAPSGGSPFAQSAANQSSSNQSFPQNPQTASQSAFTQPSQQQTNGTLSGPTQSPDPSTYTTRNANNTLRTWKNAPVNYIESIPYSKLNNGSWQRIFHPDGPPAPNADTEDRSEAYDAALEAAYAFVRETGTFKDGVMPEVPPKMEWIRFDV